MLKFSCRAWPGDFEVSRLGQATPGALEVPSKSFSVALKWLSPFLRDPQNMNSVTWLSPETGSRDRPRDRVGDTGSMLQVSFDPGSLDAALAHPL